MGGWPHVNAQGGPLENIMAGGDDEQGRPYYS